MENQAEPWWRMTGRRRRPRETVGERVKQWREDMGMTQRELATELARLGVWSNATHSAVAKLELGQRPIDTDELVALAFILKKDSSGALASSLLSDAERERSRTVLLRERIGVSRKRALALERDLEAARQEMAQAMQELERLEKRNGNGKSQAKA